MFIKIEEDKEETFPECFQFIAFKCGDIVFAGTYEGDKKAKPFSVKEMEMPTFVVSEWMPIRIWA